MRCLLLVLACAFAWGARADEAPGAPPAAPAPGPVQAEPPVPPSPGPVQAEQAAAPAAAPTQAEPPAAPPPRPATLSVLGGAGLYESLHAGLEYHTSGHNGFELFIGSNFGIPEAAVNTLGASWRHDLSWKGLGLDPAILVRAITWTSRDDLYHWKLLSLVLGGSLSKEIAPGTTIRFDAGAVYTHAIESDRQQDQSFGSPTKWNATLCISISHVLKAW
jgi:hypothetical protein